jgi:signal transduction histidine kinase
MRLSIKAKQVAGVTTIVGLAVVVLSGVYLSSLARVQLEESQKRGDLLAGAIYQRAHAVIAESTEGRDPADALREDSGLRSILEASAYSKHVTYAAIVDTEGIAIAHSDADLVGHPVPSYESLSSLLAQGPLAKIRAIYASGGRTFEIRQPLLLGATEFGSIRIGVSTLLIRSEFDESLRSAVYAVLAALGGASLVAMLLAQLLLRPIHVIRSGLTRLGRGEFGVNVDLTRDDEFGELGQFFNTISARLSADRAHAGSHNDLAPAMDQMEDAVAIVDRKGVILFANKAMRDSLPDDALNRRLEDALPDEHPYRKIVEDAATAQKPRGPLVAMLTRPAPGERMIVATPIETADKRIQAVILISRNLEYLSQVQSTVNYSRKLAALSRLSAGVAHEVKNPLNATVIHLELLKEQLAAKNVGAPTSAMDHVAVIAAQMRRLDEVVQGFLRFIRPEDLKLERVQPGVLIEAIRPIVSAEAERHGIELRIEVANSLPDVRVDAGMMQQALLNLALNACQAMPGGGRLRLGASSAGGKRVEIICEDTGPGIKPEHLDKIFDLYFTTKQSGSGIGLSMVYRAVQLHDGEIQVQSIPGRGSTFRVLLPQASASGS